MPPSSGTDSFTGTSSTSNIIPNTSRRAILEETALGLARTVGTLVAAGVAFYTGAKIAVIGQPQRPPLPGPVTTVGSRIDQIGGLRCRTFYPAVAEAQSRDAPYLTEGTKTSDAMARLVFFPGFLLEHLGTAQSGCSFEGTPLLPVSGSPQYPVLVYSHGQGGNMDMGTYFLREIASYGAVVVSVEHQDGSASTADTTNPRRFSLGQGQLGVNSRAQELVRVSEALRSSNLLDQLGGDKRRLFVGGHSYGGPTAILAAAGRPDLFGGLVLHDPALGSSMPTPPQPVYSVVGDQYAFIPGLAKEVKKVSGGAMTTSAEDGLVWAGAWHYVGISHGNFVDAPLWAPLIIMRALGLLLIPAAGPEDPAEAHRRLAESASVFMYACRGDKGPTPVVPPTAPFKRL